MIKDVGLESEWSLSPSYDIGVKHTFRNLLAGNPYRANYLRHWLATFDHENIKKYYDYETGAKKKKGDLSATEIHYDQVQQMIYNANLPVEIEFELFYHLDYHLNRENKSIDFLKLKEFFSFCGIPGVYDLENHRHFLMEKEHPFLLSNLKINSWSPSEKELNISIIARMMAEPGEVPYHAESISALKEQYNIEWMNEFSKTELHKKLMTRADSIYGSKRTAEEVRNAAEEAERLGVNLDEYDDEIEEFTKVFDQTPEARVFLDEIKALESDEQYKLSSAISKYVPNKLIESDNYLKSFDSSLGKFGRQWDLAVHDHMANADYWAAQYLGHEGPETCSSDEPTTEELGYLDPELIELGEFQVARYEHMMKKFDHEVWPAIRSRYCAIEDWILRDYTMNDINKGALAQARREDIPLLFEEALRNELSDGLLKSLNFPIRIEEVPGSPALHMLWYNNYPVEVFNPAEILPELGANRSSSAIESKHESAGYYGHSVQDFTENHGRQGDFIDFKIQSPATYVEPSNESMINMNADSGYVPPQSPGYRAGPKNPSRSFDRPLTPSRNKNQYSHKGGRNPFGANSRPMSVLKSGRPPLTNNRLIQNPLGRSMAGHGQTPGFHPQPFSIPIPIPIPKFKFSKSAKKLAEASNEINAENKNGNPPSDEALHKIRSAQRDVEKELNEIENINEAKDLKGKLAEMLKASREAARRLMESSPETDKKKSFVELCLEGLNKIIEMIYMLIKSLKNWLSGAKPGMA